MTIVDAPADAIDGELRPLRRGSKTSAARHLNKNPGSVPTGEAMENRLIAFLVENAHFRREMHTGPFRLANLAEYREFHNHGGFGVPGF